MSQTTLKLEQLSLTMLEGTLVKWRKNQGEPVAEGDLLYEVETDKIVTGIESPVTGYLGEVFVAEGSRVPTGTELCIIDTDIESAKKKKDPAEPVDDLQAPVTDLLSGAVVQRPVADQSGKAIISPLARAIAKKHSLDFSRIQGTGIGGLIVKADILRRIEENANQPSATNSVTPADDTEYTVIPFSNLRKAIASRLQASHREVPKVTTFIDVNMTNVVGCRKLIPVSYNSFILKATAEALSEYPLLNSRMGNEEVHVLKQVNLSVAIEGEEGLVTPVIGAANYKSVLDIDIAVKEYAERAKQKQLQLKDMQGGTFTVTNSGLFGSLLFTPLINYPQCAILGVGKISKEPMVVDDKIEIGYKMILCLSYDHRIVDGKYAVSFIKAIKDKLEQCNTIVFLTGSESRGRTYYQNRN